MVNEQDVMMNSFPEANDGKYIYAETSDGKQIKISKADLASILAQQNQKGYTAASDFNSLTTVGAYIFPTASITGSNNKPEGAAYGVLEVEKMGDSRLVQRYRNLSVNGEIWERSTESNGQSWWAWHRIDNFGANTPAELASVVAGQTGLAQNCMITSPGSGTNYYKIGQLPSSGNVLTIIMCAYNSTSINTTMIYNLQNKAFVLKGSKFSGVKFYSDSSKFIYVSVPAGPDYFVSLMQSKYIPVKIVSKPSDLTEIS